MDLGTELFLHLLRPLRMGMSMIIVIQHHQTDSWSDDSPLESVSRSYIRRYSLCTMGYRSGMLGSDDKSGHSYRLPGILGRLRSKFRCRSVSCLYPVSIDNC